MKQKGPTRKANTFPDPPRILSDKLESDMQKFRDNLNPGLSPRSKRRILLKQFHKPIERELKVNPDARKKLAKHTERNALKKYKWYVRSLYYVYKAFKFFIHKSPRS